MQIGIRHDPGKIGHEFAKPVDGAYLVPIVPKPLVPVRRTSKLQVPSARQVHNS